MSRISVAHRVVSAGMLMLSGLTAGCPAVDQGTDSGVAEIETPNCADGDSRVVACGLNGRGRNDETCSASGWQSRLGCVDPDVCTDLDSRAGNTSCGLNGRGSFDDSCVSGQWVVGETCVDDDVCQDDATQLLPCGLNGRGELEQSCRAGQWTDEACTDPDICLDGSQQDSSQSCGLNGRGLLVAACEAGQWWPTASCTDPDTCIDDAEQDGTTACGLNLRGVRPQVCAAGHWIDTTECDDDDRCVDGAMENGTTICGLNDRGVLSMSCTAGQWSESQVCSDPDLCVDGTTDEPGGSTCGVFGNGAFRQDCVSGNWVDTDVCEDPDVCDPDALPFGAGNGSALMPFLLCSPDHLANTGGSLPRHYRLDRDIDLTGLPFSPLEIFAGLLDGAGHAINGLHLDDQGRTGLFRLNQGTIQHLTLTNVDIVAPSTLAVTGALAGRNDALIHDCHVTGQLVGLGTVGGLVGENGLVGAISASTADVTLVVSANLPVGGLVGTNNVGGLIADCHSSGLVEGSLNVGGLVGSNRSLVIQSSSSAVVHASPGGRGGGLVGINLYGDVVASHASGDVFGYNYAGGLIGFMESSSVERSFATGNVAGHESVGGLVGMNYQGSQIVDCYATGDVSTDYTNVGGFLGVLAGPVVHSFSANTVSSTGFQGGGFVGSGLPIWLDDAFFNADLVGDVDNLLPGIPKTTAELQLASTFATWDPNVWLIADADLATHGRPRLAWEFDAPAVLSPEPRVQVVFYAHWAPTRFSGYEINVRYPELDFGVARGLDDVEAGIPTKRATLPLIPGPIEYYYTAEGHIECELGQFEDVPVVRTAVVGANGQLTQTITDTLGYDFCDY